MNRQLLTLGIVLSLGTIGCAGFGVQQGSSLNAQLQHEQGLDELWSATENVPTQGLDTPRYVDQSLGALWNGNVEGPDGVRDDGSARTPNQGDLWNPASVARSWEITERTETKPSRGLLFGASSGREIWY